MVCGILARYPERSRRVEPFPWDQRLLIINADALLGYSLGGLAFMAFLSCAFVGYNTTVYPVEFYGSDRLGLTNAQFFLGITALAGHIWHASRPRLNS